MYSTRKETEAAHYHLLQMEQSGIVEIIDHAHFVCLRQSHIEFWTPSGLEDRPHPRSVIRGLDPALLAISEPAPRFETINRSDSEWVLSEELGELPLADEIRNYLLPAMAGLVLVVEPQWSNSVLEGIDGYERSLKRRLTISPSFLE
jgi:hypothetical protein